MSLFPQMEYGPREPAAGRLAQFAWGLMVANGSSRRNHRLLFIITGRPVRTKEMSPIARAAYGPRIRLRAIYANV